MHYILYWLGPATGILHGTVRGSVMKYEIRAWQGISCVYVAGLLQASSFLPRVVVLYQDGCVGCNLVIFVVCTVLFSQGLIRWVGSVGVRFR